MFGRISIISYQRFKMSKAFKISMIILGAIILLGIIMTILNPSPKLNDEQKREQEKLLKQNNETNSQMQQPIASTTQVATDHQQQHANKVAEDYIDQYNIAKGNGDKARMCALAGLVATAYLNAKDDENYRLWRYYEQKDCK
jgi:hypothetical protein